MSLAKRMVWLLPVIVLMAGCGGGENDFTPAPAEPERVVKDMELTSNAFANGESVPARHSCDGEDISPSLEWSQPPQNTQSFTLICDDPDAPRGTWVHWVVFNLPSETRVLPEGVTSESGLPAGSLHGKNNWGDTEYGGPCPPGGTHRYYFKLYALDTTLDLKTGAGKSDVLHAMDGHVLAQAELMGTYERK